MLFVCFHILSSYIPTKQITSEYFAMKWNDCGSGLDFQLLSYSYLFLSVLIVKLMVWVKVQLKVHNSGVNFVKLRVQSLDKSRSDLFIFKLEG